MKKMVRNRVLTSQRIIDTLEQILAEGGTEAVSINLIAERAGVSKALIYRYFGGVDGLLEYFVRMGRMFPHYTPAWLEQIQPAHPGDLANLWSSQSLQLFRHIRVSRSARELFKAGVKDNDPLADVISKAQDGELTHLVDQLAFIKGCDYHAISAIILGALSYLTIQAQNDRTVIGIDLRSEEGWQRIEKAVSIIYKAVGRSAIDSSNTNITTKLVDLSVSAW
ncbi:TetR/AcrR family transcriptional regulator [Spirosoma sp. RP8]|uniref:TetR/AcrR family transcriptional regulator n=1 Tax=Spirosoma liriopis TaxID=2937440 RepID=A0ABT0HHV1_9BACT|nr:TetR/AcrR family transcriptional regulator [Spirosoma liriopis]MCK8491742.1 TetR/AcrR family transcriptional regulator [Spirosoma liriopis]